jgi:N-acetylneuraminic acid mutarotase
MWYRHVRALALALLAGVALLIAHPRATNGTWTIMPPLPAPTQEVSVIALNNLVYVAAGSANQVRTNAVWTFNPTTGAWASMAPYPGTPRDHVGITTLGGYIYLTGGHSRPSPISIVTIR